MGRVRCGGSRLATGVALLAALVVSAGSVALGGTTTRVSVATDHTQGDHSSQNPAISSNGQFVAFFSRATNLVPGAETGFAQVLVNDLQTGETTCVSVASDGSLGIGDSYYPSISSDGRFVAFSSRALNLVPGGTTGEQVFVHDRLKAVTTCVSVNAFGSQGNDVSHFPSISGDGKFVAFQSYATNLIPGGTSGNGDVFVYDFQAATTTCVSAAPNGTPGNGSSDRPSISANGGFVAFDSVATNLVTGATSGKGDVFVRALPAGPTTCVSVASDGTQANNGSAFASISSDGRFVAFSSLASNLVPGDTNGKTDVFVHDRQTGATTRVSLAGGGSQGNDSSGSPSISGDGRFVAFHSDATNLVPGATKGGVFVRDLQARQTLCVSVAAGGTQGNGYSDLPSISAAGQLVAFESDATNLVPGDTNKTTDVFVNQLGAPAPLPDLQGCACTAPAAAFWGQAINVACQIQNTGAAAAGAFQVEWYLSQDAVGSTVDDVLLSQTNGKGTFHSHGGIAAGAKGPAFTVTLQVPASLPSGWIGTAFYILMRTDSAGAVPESNEDNNFGQVGDNLDRAPIGITTSVPKVTYPSLPDEVWLPGKAYPITWVGFLASTVKVELFKGGILNKTIVASTPNKGSFKWTVPATQPLGSDYAVKVSSTAPAASDSSDSPLTIANPKVAYPTLAGVAWLGGNSYTITWSGFPDASVNVDLYAGGVLNRNIATKTPNAGSFAWTVPTNVPAGPDYQVQVSSPTNPNLFDGSDQPFTIAQPKVTAPTDAGIAWLGGENHDLTWTGFPGPTVKIELIKAKGPNKVLAAAAPNTGTFGWTVPLTQLAGDDYTVKVTATASKLVFDSSDNPFTLAVPQVTYPTKTGVTLHAGKPCVITWKGFPGATVKVDLYQGGVLSQIIAPAATNKGSFAWVVPAGQAPGPNYKIQVSMTAGPAVTDTSDSPFAIASP